MLKIQKRAGTIITIMTPQLYRKLYFIYSFFVCLFFYIITLSGIKHMTINPLLLYKDDNAQSVVSV